MRLKIFFEPRDMWVGVFWCWRQYDLKEWITRCPASPDQPFTYHAPWFLTVYICLVPCLPLRVEFRRD